MHPADRGDRQNQRQTQTRTQTQTQTQSQNQSQTPAHGRPGIAASRKGLGILLTVLLLSTVTACGGRRPAPPTPTPTPTPSLSLSPKEPAFIPKPAPLPDLARHPSIQPGSRTAAQQARVWRTTADGKSVLAPGPAVTFHPGSAPAAAAVVSVDTSTKYHRFWGVGASLTGASAALIGALSPAARDRLMGQLFSRSDGAGLSVLRQPLGANDFSVDDLSYDPAPAGQTDQALRWFSLGSDGRTVLPLVRQAKRLNSSLSVVVTPWSAPAWMKTSGKLIGGTLRSDRYDVYARYLVKTLQAYRDAGVPVASMTLQNEPSFSPPGYPGMTLSVTQQRQLLDNHLAPALAAAGLKPGVWGLDDNFDRAGDASALVTQAVTRTHLAGIAFHCYRGGPGAIQQFHSAHSGVPLAISECSGGAWDNNFGSALSWDVRNLLITGIRGGATWVSKWNVALSPTGGPTNGGCLNCRGLVTIDPATGAVSRNADYWALAHLGRFVTPGANVIASTNHSGGIETVAFVNPDGSRVLMATNAGSRQADLQVRADGGWFTYSLPAGAVATFAW